MGMNILCCYSKSMKIAIFTRELDEVLGGMEKQILEICSYLAIAGHQVVIYTLDEKQPKVFYETKYIGFNIKNIKTSNPKIGSTLRQKVIRQWKVFIVLKKNKPDIGISFMFGSFLYSRVPTKLLKIPLVLAERNSPDIYKLTKIRRKRYFLYLAMGLADAITVQFSRYSAKYPTFLQKKMWTIPNAVPKIEESPSRKSRDITFIFAGRFSFQKKVVELVNAFSEHLQTYPNSKLRIYGSGEKKLDIQNAISARGIQNNVQIFAPEKNILDVFRTGDCICVPSIWEGFPNVLAEALSFGIPGLGFSNCDGVSDLLQDNVNGWLEFDDGNINSLVQLLDRAANDLSTNHLMVSNCKNSVSKYSQNEVSNLWNELIEFVASK